MLKFEVLKLWHLAFLEGKMAFKYIHKPVFKAVMVNMSSDSDYVCTLDQASIKKAKAELNENPEDRLAAVQALRDWIQEQPHLKCPRLDTSTLLKYLRGAKFSQLRAREMFEANLAMKSAAPQWFKDIDTRDPKLIELLNTGYVAPLPKSTPDGCQIIVYRLGRINPKKFNTQSLARIATVVVDYISQSETTQVNGTVLIMDFTTLTPAHLKKIMSSDMQKWQKMWQKNMPGRFKSINFYNAGLFIDALMAFVRPFLPKKWIDRMKTHDTMETIYKEIPMECLPEEYLPDEYTGPNVGSIDDITNNFISTIQKSTFHDQLLLKTSDAFSVDESKKPTEQVAQHFRKLNVD